MFDAALDKNFIGPLFVPVKILLNLIQIFNMFIQLYGPWNV